MPLPLPLSLPSLSLLLLLSLLSLLPLLPFAPPRPALAASFAAKGRGGRGVRPPFGCPLPFYAIVSKRSIGTAPSTGFPAKQSTSACTVMSPIRW